MIRIAEFDLCDLCGAGGSACHFLMRISRSARTYIGNAGISPKIAAHPSRRLSSLRNLALMGFTPGKTRTDHLCNSRPRLRSARPYSRQTLVGAAMAQRSQNRQTGVSGHSDRRSRTRFLSPRCLGGDAEPCAFANPSARPHSGNHAMVEGINRQSCKSDPRSNGTTVLAGRILGSLSAQAETNRQGGALYRKESGLSGAGRRLGKLGLVQRRMAGGTACPTKTDSLKQKVAQ